MQPILSKLLSGRIWQKCQNVLSFSWKLTECVNGTCSHTVTCIAVCCANRYSSVLRFHWRKIRRIPTAIVCYLVVSLYWFALCAVLKFNRLCELSFLLLSNNWCVFLVVVILSLQKNNIMNKIDFFFHRKNYHLALVFSIRFVLHWGEIQYCKCHHFFIQFSPSIYDEFLRFTT